MALEVLEDRTVPRTTTAYPLRWRSRAYAIVGLVLILGITVVVTSAIGSTDIPLSTLCQVLLAKLPFVEVTPTWASSVETILLDIRLPRLFLAGLVGASLAVAGATYQGLFRNPLADPYLIGVAQGAALGAVIGFLLPASWQAASIPLLAFAGALLAVAVVYSIARVGKTLPMTTLILAGVALGAFLAAITSYLMIASGDKLHGIISWLLGTFSLTSWWQVTMVAPYVFVGTVVIWLHARPLNVMQLDEEQAQQLGINVEQMKLILLGAATLITAVAVCFCGIIGFVGIIIPHAVRLIWGPDHRFLLPLSTFAGAIFLILADTAARTVLAPTEIPVGVITAFLGAPFFLYLLRQKKRAIF
ncbi:MAG: iron chelate uptake ABC transporter family permease subunit [Dehalococcoidia bacterium]|nr:iron chelate uptake ABC transporter family permease subunit [Dehalococcoidia bacterium]